MAKSKIAPAAIPAELLTDAEACAFLHITSRTLRLWRRTRGLPHIRISGKEIRYRRSDLDAWLNGLRVAFAA
jgi:excisionase family DNA binding protein